MVIVAEKATHTIEDDEIDSFYPKPKAGWINQYYSKE